MWRDKLIEIKKEKGITTKEWSQLSGVPVDTINRIVNSKKDKKEFPRIDTIEDLCYGLGVEVWEIFYLGDHSLVALQAEINTLKSERDDHIARIAALELKNTMLAEENKDLKHKVIQLSDELINLLKDLRKKDTN